MFAILDEMNFIISIWSVQVICYSQHIGPNVLQATMLFIVTSATKGVPPPLRFRVRFTILYRDIVSRIHPLIQLSIQHCLLRKMGYLNMVYMYVIATRNYEYFYYRHCSVINELLRYSTVTTYVLAK